MYGWAQECFHFPLLTVILFLIRLIHQQRSEYLLFLWYLTQKKTHFFHHT